MAAVAEHERQQRLLQMLDESGQVSVTQLSELFEVSPVTVRGDLNDLERRRMLRRVRGGAVSAQDADEGSFELRLRHSADVKRAIARHAASLVHDGDTIAIDCSTSAYFLAREMMNRRGLVVITNGLSAASLLGSNNSFTVFLPGGTIRRSSWSLVGDFGAAFRTHGSVSKGFFGLRSVSPLLGLMELSAEEGNAKRQLVGACEETYGLFDSTKVGRFALNSFASPAEVSGLITDDRVDDETVKQWKAHGVEITRVAIGLGEE